MHTDAHMAAAADPNTDQAVLAELAHQHPELRATIAGNPNTYPALLEWLAAFSDPQIDHAPASNYGAPVASPPASGGSPVWRGYSLRLGLGVLGLTLGLALFIVQAFLPDHARVSVPFRFVSIGGFTGILVVLLIAVLLAAAVAVLPAHPVRTVSAAIIVLLCVVSGFALQEAFQLAGVGYGVSNAISHTLMAAGVSIAWLLARARPARSWLTLLLLGAVIALTEPTSAFSFRIASSLTSDSAGSRYLELSDLFLSLNSSLLYTTQVVLPVVIIIVLAALLDPKKSKRQARIAAREAELAQLGAASARAKESAEGAVALSTVSLLALIFGFVTPLVGVILGAVAHRSILTTGQRGWGLATAGIVVGGLSMFLGLLVPLAVALVVVAVSPELR